MTKTVCDFCKKEMPTPQIRILSDYNFSVCKYGKPLDICNECRTALNEWIKEREKEGKEK